MAVSRRLRYEILRRDNHTCRYCGATAPDVNLTVDHVVPTTLGGGDEASNLVTACADCNAGKSSSSPDAPIVTGVADDALRWAAAMKQAAGAQAAQAENRQRYLDDFEVIWCHSYDTFYVPLPEGWEVTIGQQFDNGIELAVLTAAALDVIPRVTYVPADKIWPYFCTVVRRVVRERQEIAARLIDEGLA